MTQPRLSVVIASADARAPLAACLAALAAQSDSDQLEIIVAIGGDTVSAAAIQHDHANIHLITDPQPRSLAILRGRAIAVSRAPVIAILDPYAIVAANWSQQLLAAHQAHANPIIGGAVAPGIPTNGSIWQWALYINEYGIFLPPIAPGPTTIVPGCNVSYKRGALFDGDRPRFPIFWKTFVNWATTTAVLPPILAPDVLVTLHKPIPFADFLRTRFNHGRCFAAMRVAGKPWLLRPLRALTTPLLPLLLTWRWGRHFWPKRRHRRRFVQTLPLQLLLFANWALGEAAGYLFGAGDSCDQLYY